MSDVDLMFEKVVDPWWTHNSFSERLDFDGLRDGIASYSALCRHAAWNDIGRWFIRGKGGSEQRELIGLQCLVEGLLSSPTCDSAAWTAFRGSTRTELASIQSKLAGLPSRSQPRDSDAIRLLVDELRTILGKPGDV
jgi:hypothetical protein